MTCERMKKCANGDYCNYHVGFLVSGCMNFKEKKPLTNEEWFDTLSTTEEKAEAIYECVMANSCSFSKDGIKRWLKQPHRDEIRSDDMKCPICDGTGEVANYHKIDFDEPTEPITNEEWFSGLPSTKKSEFMAKMVNEAIEVHEKHGATWHESTIWWDGWLKQPHDTIKE